MWAMNIYTLSLSVCVLLSWLCCLVIWEYGCVCVLVCQYDFRKQEGGELLTGSAIHVYNRRDDFAPILSGIPIFKKNILTYEQVRENHRTIQMLRCPIPLVNLSQCC